MLDHEASQAIRPILKKYIDMGYSVRDIHNILSGAVTDTCLEEILELRYKTPVEATDKTDKVEYDFCPHCRGRFTFNKPVDNKCPWCMKEII